MNRWMGLALLLVVLWLLSDVVLLVLAAILVAVALRGAADWLSGASGLSPQSSLAIVTLAILGGFAAVGWWSGPALLDQAGQLWEQILAASGRVRDLLQQTNWGRTMLRVMSPEKLVSGAGAIAGTIPALVSSTIGVFGSLLIILVTAIYLAAAPRTYTHGVVTLVPIRYRSRAREILAELGETLRGWLFGQMIDMAIVAALTAAGLLMLGIPLALPLAIVAGLFNFVPYIGAIAGAVPAILIAFGQSPIDALWVALLFIVIQTAEGYFIMPQIQKRTIDLPRPRHIVANRSGDPVRGIRADPRYSGRRRRGGGGPDDLCRRYPGRPGGRSCQGQRCNRSPRLVENTRSSGRNTRISRPFKCVILSEGRFWGRW